MLLYLNKDTFIGPNGAALADELRCLRAHGVPIVLVHECRAQEGGCEFDRFFHVTPPDLAQGGLYKEIALPLHASDRHLATTLSLIATRLGATKRPTTFSEVVKTPMQAVRPTDERSSHLRHTPVAEETSTADEGRWSCKASTPFGSAGQGWAWPKIFRAERTESWSEA